MSGRPLLVERVDRALRGPIRLPHGASVLVGVSGGPDSVGLLGVLVELSGAWGLRLGVAHLDHGLRGEEAGKREAALVEKLGRGWGLPFFFHRLPPGALAGPNLEARARAARSDFFARVRRREGFTFVALGHTAEDQAETLLLRLIRGAGRHGLGGMEPRRRDGTIRPLLGCRRSLVQAYLAARDLPWAVDPTNRDPRWTRNRVRSDLIPLLAARFQPDIVRVLARTAALLRAEDRYLQQRALAAEKAVRDDQGQLRIAALAALPLALRRRVVRLWLERGGAKGVSTTHVRTIIGLARRQFPHGCVALPGGRRLIIDGRCGRVSLDEPARLSAAVPVRPGSRVEGKGSSWRFELGQPEPWRGGAWPATRWEAVFDAERLPEPLTLRPAQPGDRISPLGRQRARKVSDVLGAGKPPRGLRRTVPVLVAGQEVIWVPGACRGETAKVERATRRVVRARLWWESSPTE